MKEISVNDLRKMDNTEGLILQGCGGNLQEWVDGINELLTEENILQNGDIFKDVSHFEFKGISNLLFSMENVDLNVGKLAMWRLSTHDNFAGTWLSDYRDNQLGMKEENEMQMGDQSL